jgi:putative ABC transport system ATP-binding protein
LGKTSGKVDLEPLLKVSLDSLHYADKVLLRDVDLSVQKGDRVLIVGATGSGKSSLLNSLNLMNYSYEGSITLSGKDIRALRPEALRARICMVMQEPWLDPGTVMDALDEPLHYAARKHNPFPHRERRVKELLSAFRLPEGILEQSTEKLSGGEKQRVALVRALQLDPEILLLDEISSALDQHTSGIISDCIFNNYPGTVIAISHDPLWQNRWQRVWSIRDGMVSDSTREE